MATSPRVWAFRALSSWRTLPDTDRRFSLRAFALAPVVWSSLRALGFERTMAPLGRIRRPHRPSHPRVTVERGAELVRRTLRPWSGDGGCLLRALVQYALHAADGTEAVLRIGVRRPEKGSAIPLDAHAWIDPPGEPPPEPQLGYLVLYERSTP
jgi:hypothetical protein